MEPDLPKLAASSRHFICTSKIKIKKMNIYWILLPKLILYVLHDLSLLANDIQSLRHIEEMGKSCGSIFICSNLSPYFFYSIKI